MIVYIFILEFCRIVWLIIGKEVCKLSFKDRLIRWTFKFTKTKPKDGDQVLTRVCIPFFGYKSHISINREFKLILKWRVLKNLSVLRNLLRFHSSCVDWREWRHEATQFLWYWKATSLPDSLGDQLEGFLALWILRPSVLIWRRLWPVQMKNDWLRRFRFSKESAQLYSGPWEKGRI